MLEVDDMLFEADDMFVLVEDKSIMVGLCMLPMAGLCILRVVLHATFDWALEGSVLHGAGALDGCVLLQLLHLLLHGRLLLKLGEGHLDLLLHDRQLLHDGRLLH